VIAGDKEFRRKPAGGEEERRILVFTRDSPPLLFSCNVS
jgi:hypothetical protein